MSANIPRKGDIIINPNTQRPVKVGSRTWLKLVKQGVVEGRYTDPKELKALPEQYEELPPEEIEEEIKKANQGLPRHQQAVRGRGRYKGKIVKRNRRLQPEEVSKYTAQVATRTVANNIEQLAEVEDDDIEGMLEKMILEEMMNGSRPQTAPLPIKRGRGRPKKQTQREEKYQEIQPQEYDYEDEQYLEQQEGEYEEEEYEGDYGDYEYE
jgi:hypothetical protein